MKTIGEIISSARVSQNLSLEDVGKSTKIDVKYLKALEENRFDLLPPPTFTKGFIRNIAKTLGKSPDDLVAIYRRDLPAKSAGVPKKQISSFVSTFNHSPLILIATGIIVFLTYLGFQYRALLVPPPLTLTQPDDKAVLTSPFMVEGKTSTDSLISINPDIDVKPSSNGTFSHTVNLSPGEHELVVSATNRFGKTATKKLTVTVISSD